jgi:hypothetical protein
VRSWAGLGAPLAITMRIGDVVFLITIGGLVSRAGGQGFYPCTSTREAVTNAATLSSP